MTYIRQPLSGFERCGIGDKSFHLVGGEVSHQVILYDCFGFRYILKVLHFGLNLGRAYADGVFIESEYENRRTKLLNEKASLVVPDGAKVIEIGLRLESLQEFLEYATDDEKYQILHILFDFVNYDFKQAKIISFKPKAEFAVIFRLAAPLTGWHEREGNVFDLAHEIVDTQN